MGKNPLLCFLSAFYTPILLPVQRTQFIHRPAHLLNQGFRSQYLQGGTVGKQFLHKIEGRLEPQPESHRILVLRYQFLTVMERTGTDIVSLFHVELQNDMLHPGIVVDDTVCIIEHHLRHMFGRHLEAFRTQLGTVHTVERIDPHPFTLATKPDQVPALLEELDEIRLHRKGSGFPPIGMIHDGHTLVLHHCFGQDIQVFLTAEGHFQHNPVVQLPSPGNHVRRSSSPDEPLVQRRAVDFFRCVDVVFIRTAVTLDVDVEHLFGQTLVFHERIAVQFDTVFIAIFLPGLLYFLQGNPLAPEQQTHQPYTDSVFHRTAV